MPGGPLGGAGWSGPGRGSGQGRGQTGRLGAGGRPLKRPPRLPPPASRLLHPRAPAPRPGARLHPCPLRRPACARGRQRVTEPDGQSAPGAARRQTCHSSRRVRAEGRGLAAGGGASRRRGGLRGSGGGLEGRRSPGRGRGGPGKAKGQRGEEEKLRRRGWAKTLQSCCEENSSKQGLLSAF